MHDTPGPDRHAFGSADPARGTARPGGKPQDPAAARRVLARRRGDRPVPVRLGRSLAAVPHLRPGLALLAPHAHPRVRDLRLRRAGRPAAGRPGLRPGRPAARAAGGAGGADGLVRAVHRGPRNLVAVRRPRRPGPGHGYRAERGQRRPAGPARAPGPGERRPGQRRGQLRRPRAGRPGFRGPGPGGHGPPDTALRDAAGPARHGPGRRILDAGAGAPAHGLPADPAAPGCARGHPPSVPGCLPRGALLLVDRRPVLLHRPRALGAPVRVGQRDHRGAGRHPAHPDGSAVPAGVPPGSAPPFSAACASWPG